MIFIYNKYHKIYSSIIDNALSREILENAYYETHHIIPKALGGTNHVTNLVKLTAKEHFLCHRLLTKCTAGKHKAKMVFALNCMLRSTVSQDRHVANSREYDYIKKLVSKEMSKLHSGKHVSDETRLKISNSRKGKVPWMKGRTHDEHTRERIKDGVSKVKPQTCEHCGVTSTPSNISRWHGDNCKTINPSSHNPKITCEHCHKTIGVANYSRWHGDNCKYS